MFATYLTNKFIKKLNYLKILFINDLLFYELFN